MNYTYPSTGKRTVIEWRDPESGLTLVYASIEPGASSEAVLRALDLIRGDIRTHHGAAAAETVAIRGE